MKIENPTLDTNDDFTFPAPLFYLANLVDYTTPLVKWISKLESAVLRKKMQKKSLKKPIFITGLARAGTTINLEMLDKHPDVATHKYFHIPLAYLSYIWRKFGKRT